MKTYKGNWASTFVPLGLASMVGGAGIVGLIIGSAVGPIRPPSPVHAACICIISAFLCFCAWSLIRVALKGFYTEVVMNEKGLTLTQVGSSREIQWQDLDRVISRETGLNLRITTGQEFELNPSLENFDELRDRVKRRFDQDKGVRSAPPPGGHMP